MVACKNVSKVTSNLASVVAAKIVLLEVSWRSLQLDT
jgi:hypothetical protein